ncbi:hypothetical protein ACW9H6_25130 [Pseudomonas sp. SDO528_S397]
MSGFFMKALGFAGKAVVAVGKAVIEEGQKRQEIKEDFQGKKSSELLGVAKDNRTFSGSSQREKDIAIQLLKQRKAEQESRNS